MTFKPWLEQNLAPTDEDIHPAISGKFNDTPSLPMSIPNLDNVRRFSVAHHVNGKAWEGVLLSWPARYLPEIAEAQAEFEIYDEQGNVSIEIRYHRSPAYFSIGIEGVWHFACLWEHGAMQEPEETLYSNLAHE